MSYRNLTGIYSAIQELRYRKPQWFEAEIYRAWIDSFGNLSVDFLLDYMNAVRAKQYETDLLNSRMHDLLANEYKTTIFILKAIVNADNQK